MQFVLLCVCNPYDISYVKTLCNFNIKNKTKQKQYRYFHKMLSNSVEEKK